MGQTGRKIPEITFLYIRDLRTAFLIQNRDAAIAVGHDGPLRLLVPVELANAARAETHVDACDGRRDVEIVSGDLPCPAAVLNAFGHKIKGRPELRHAVDVGG